MALSDYFRRVLIVAIGVVATIIVVTTIMTFIKISPYQYNPYMYFLISLGVLAIFLSPQTLSVAD
jgi:hypothetical protein